MLRPALLTVLVLSVAACGRAPEADESPAPSVAAAPDKATPQKADGTTLKPLAKKKFGGEITEKSSVTLTDIVRHPQQFSAKTVRTEGLVSAVCKNKGCWMELADSAGFAHVKMAGHSFFVPRDSAGHRAIIQGKVITMPADDHCSEEAREQTGQVAKVEIEATGVEFVD
jgi:hypothetical protein